MFQSVSGIKNTRFIFGHSATRRFLVLIALIVQCAAPQLAQSEIIFQDDFETADKSATNADGFVWGHGRRVAVVMQDPVDGPVKVYEQAPIYEIQDATMPDGATRDWTAFNGEYSLMFNYPSVAEMEATGVEPFSEIRFDIGVPRRELWISFMLKVPPNYNHSPAINNKLFTIWMDGYLQSGEGTTLLVQYWPDQAGGAYLHWQRSSNFDTVNTVQTYDDFLHYPTDQGRWMQLVIHLKASSTNAKSDGKIGIWRRWDGDSLFTNIADWNGIVPVPESDPIGWKAGYIMGWANKGFEVETEWQIDNFILSTTSLITGASKPLPPTLEEG